METLKKVLEDKAIEHAFSGVVSIFCKDRSIYSNAFGYRDLNNRIANQPDTRFGIASGTKLFTALGIGKLIDQGHLTLETKVGAIDPTYIGFIGPEATIQHLLTHTSGIYDYYDEEAIADFDHYSTPIAWSELETPSYYWPLFAGQTMKFTPGERYAYSNGGFVFLVLLLEKISGQLYREFIEKEILQPAGMADSGFYAFNDLPTNTAYGYLADGHKTNIYHLPIRGGGDGGMYTTAEDLHRFWPCFFADKILSSKLRAQFIATQHEFSKESGYGCGIYKDLDNSAFSIVGEDAGVSFYSRYYPQQQIVVNILSNTTDGVSILKRTAIEQVERLRAVEAI